MVQYSTDVVRPASTSSIPVYQQCLLKISYVLLAHERITVSPNLEEIYIISFIRNHQYTEGEDTLCAPIVSSELLWNIVISNIIQILVPNSKDIICNKNCFLHS